MRACEARIRKRVQSLTAASMRVFISECKSARLFATAVAIVKRSSQLRFLRRRRVLRGSAGLPGHKNVSKSFRWARQLVQLWPPASS